jgi:hypothetical protein
MAEKNPSTIISPNILTAGLTTVQYRVQLGSVLTPTPASTTPAPAKTIGQLWPR